jgi:hypothetical protein
MKSLKSLRLFSYNKTIFDILVNVKKIKTKHGVFATLQKNDALDFLQKEDVYLANRSFITTTESEYFRIIKENDFIKPSTIKKKNNILYLYFDSNIQQYKKFFYKKDLKIKKKKKNFQNKKNVINILEQIVHYLKIKSLTHQFQRLFKRSRKSKEKKYKLINSEINNKSEADAKADNIEDDDSPKHIYLEDDSPKSSLEKKKKKKKENFENLEKKKEFIIEEKIEKNEIEEKVEKNQKKDSGEKKKKDLKQKVKKKKKVIEKKLINKEKEPDRKKVEKALLETKKKVKKLIQSKIEKNKNFSSFLKDLNEKNNSQKGDFT